MDIFEKFIEENKQNTTCRALTCKSYAKVIQNEHREAIKPNQNNFELATYGDALLNFAL